MELDHITPGRGLAKKWFFRISLLFGAVACFMAPVITMIDRYELSNGVPATIERASKYLAAPTQWSDYEGRLHASYEVKVHPVDGPEFVTPLFLPKEVIESLTRGEKAEIVYVKERPGRHLLKGQPLPAIAWGWIVGGVMFMGLFIFSLRLR